MSPTVLALCLAMLAAADPQPILQPQPFLPLVAHESGQSFWQSRATRVDLIADRHVYWADELHGQFLALFFGKVQPGKAADHHIDLTLTRDDDGQVVEQTRLSDVQTPKLPILLATHRLAVGRYTLKATLVGPDGASLAEVTRSFERSDRSAPRVEFPRDGIPIHVHEQAHVPDAAWPISTGVPMPKMTLRDVSELALLEDGKPVAAQFSERGTWSPRGYIKWVGVDFLARYDQGKPRQYRLVRHAKPVAPATPLRVQQDEQSITIDTGAIRFAVNRHRFAGLEKVWLGERLIVDGPAGSSVTDQDGLRYEAARDEQAQVTLEDVGPLRATVAARGWYVSQTGEKFCKFIVRITAYAGRPELSVVHRTILTSKPVHGDARYIADASFSLASAGALGRGRFGADSSVIEADGPEVSLHQERSDRFRILRGDQETTWGRRSDGWFAAQNDAGQIAATLRDLWQKFPAELSLSPQAMTLHFWPKHGRDVFSDDEELARDQIYKVRFAHEGRTLNMAIPDKHHDRIKALDETEHWAGGAELYVVDQKRNRTKAQIYDGQGAVLGGEFVLAFAAKPKRDAELTAWARLVQQSPHALADARWNCATGALGPIAARDPQQFTVAEQLLDQAYNFYRRGIIDAGDEYGRWIYGGVHSAWVPTKNHANLTRVWQMCHYQNVYQSWLLYFRSGLRDHYDWATIHTNQHMDVGVINHASYPEGTHSYARLGDMGGGIYHCKGYVPWGGNASTTGHWIDLANYFVRYQLTGDRRGLDMADRWIATMGIVGTSNKTIWPSDAAGFRDNARIDAWRKANPDAKPGSEPQDIKDELAKPAPFNPREEFVPLGELTYYYTSTWDPQALLYLDQFAECLNTPFRLTSSPSLAHFGKHWQDWYYDLSRDARVVQRIEEYLQEQSQLRNPPRLESFASFMHHATGSTQWIAPLITDVYRSTLNIYDNPEDRYHGYCLAHNNPASMLLGRLPQFLHAVQQANLPFEPRPQDPSPVPMRSGRVDHADKWQQPPRGWTNTSVTILGWTPSPTRVAVSIDGPLGYGNFRGGYQLFYDWPVLGAINLQNLREFHEQQKQNLVSFSTTTDYNDPPTLRNYGAGRPDKPQALPYVELADNDPQRRFYRLEVGGGAIELPALLEAQSRHPLPQVAVIARTIFTQNQAKSAAFSVTGVCDLLLRPLDPAAVITLNLQAVEGRYAMPTTLTVTDARGQVVTQTSVFVAGQRPQVSVRLDPAVHPIPWRMRSAAQGDNQFTFEGAEELFFARTEADFEAILSKLQVKEGP